MNPTNRMTIIFSGMAGSGKSSLAREMAKRFELKYVAGGDILKEMAVKRGYDSSGGNDWWETPAGIKFLAERKNNFGFDKELDKIMIQKAKEGGYSLTSWAIPWLGAPGIKIWVDSSQKVRAKRIAGRDRISNEDALKYVKTRDKENISLYKKMYGYTLGKDLDVFDLVLDANEKTVEELASEVGQFIKNKIKK